MKSTYLLFVIMLFVSCNQDQNDRLGELKSSSVIGNYQMIIDGFNTYSGKVELKKGLSKSTNYATCHLKVSDVQDGYDEYYFDINLDCKDFNFRTLKKLNREDIASGMLHKQQAPLILNLHDNDVEGKISNIQILPKAEVPHNIKNQDIMLDFKGLGMVELNLENELKEYPFSLEIAFNEKSH